MVKKEYGNSGYTESFLSFASSMSEQEIKDRIKQAAHDLVMQYSIRSVSMDDIANRLGMSKKTIYIYFKDKDELVKEVVEDVISRNQEICRADKVKAENAIHEIFLSMEMVVEMFRKMNPSVLFDMQKYHPAAFNHFLSHKNDFIYNVMRQNLKRGQAEGLYRESVNINIMARFRVESMMLLFNPEFLHRAGSTLLEVEEQVITHWVFGLATEKGHKTIMKYLNRRTKDLTASLPVK